MSETLSLMSHVMSTHSRRNPIKWLKHVTELLGLVRLSQRVRSPWSSRGCGPGWPEPCWWLYQTGAGPGEPAEGWSAESATTNTFSFNSVLQNFTDATNPNSCCWSLCDTLRLAELHWRKREAEPVRRNISVLLFPSQKIKWTNRLGEGTSHTNVHICIDISVKRPHESVLSSLLRADPARWCILAKLNRIKVNFIFYYHSPSGRGLPRYLDH